MQIRRTTAAIALTAILLLGGFNAYQSHVIKAQRQIIVELYYGGMELMQYVEVLQAHLKQALDNVENCSK